jgi:hypothetical protein
MSRDWTHVVDNYQGRPYNVNLVTEPNASIEIDTISEWYEAESIPSVTEDQIIQYGRPTPEDKFAKFKYENPRKHYDSAQEKDVLKYFGSQPNHERIFGSEHGVENFLAKQGIEDELINEFIQEMDNVPKSSIDLTLPRHNYMGPGTDVVANVLNYVEPRDYADRLSLRHDIKYAVSKNQYERLDADLDFMNNNKEYGKVSVSDYLEAKVVSNLLTLKAQMGTEYLGDELARQVPLVTPSAKTRKQRRAGY